MLFSLCFNSEINADFQCKRPMLKCKDKEKDPLLHVRNVYNPMCVVNNDLLDPFFFLTKKTDIIWHDNETEALEKGVLNSPLFRSIVGYLQFLQFKYAMSRSLYDIFIKLLECYKVKTVEKLLFCLRNKQQFCVYKVSVFVSCFF